MTIALGWICLFCFLALVIKYPLRKLGLAKANAFMMKLHEVASGTLFLAGLLHMILALVKKRKNVLLIVSGSVLFAILFIIVAACHMTKDYEVKMKWHRILSLLAVLALAAHMILFFI